MALAQFYLTFCNLSLLLAQKKAIDIYAIQTWPSLNDVKISSDGQYAIYSLDNGSSCGATLVLQSTSGNWKTEIKSNIIGGAEISADSRYAVFIKGNDSLGIVRLGSKLIEYISNVSSFDVPKFGNGEWLIYKLETDRKLIIRNLKNGRKKEIKDVQTNFFDDHGKILVLQKDTIINHNVVQSIDWIDLGCQKTIRIWKGNESNNLIIDNSHNQLVFKSDNTIWHYKWGANKAICLGEPQVKGDDNDLKFDGISRFSVDGERLFVTLLEQVKTKPKTGSVEIWSYRDSLLQSLQESQLGMKSHLAVYRLRDHKMVQLEYGHERLDFSNGDTLGLIKYEAGTHTEKWSDAYRLNNHLINLITGERKPLKILDGNATVSISPGGKYLLYNKDGEYFSYEILTDRVQSIDKNRSLNLNRIDYYGSGPSWSRDDKNVLIIDKNDVWELDLTGRVLPKNITNGYGKKNNIVFSFALENGGSKIIEAGEKIILSAFNPINKDNGFFSKVLGQIGDPTELTMGSYIYDTKSSYVPYNFGPVKAENSSNYIVRRMSAREAPNYYSTTDFIKFRKLSNFEPSKNYNWYSTELHSWKSLDGRILQGILYKPENFDPKKKYPIIFNYYEHKSDGLNAYIKPTCDFCNINIPTYVSNGYLVFVPDIWRRIGNPMQSSYDAIISAANYMSSLSFVDAKKMGIQGCSWGGGQTYYIITHTKMFAAVCAASGITDWISHYGALGPSGESRQAKFEQGQYKIGASLWEKPDVFVKSSSVLYADRVTSPILMMHTRKDENCDFSNAMEFFTAMRRLGKKSWMVVYPNASHGLVGKDAEDFSVRMMQFFDHYLKDKSAPLWMTRGVSASKRGLDSGLEYDMDIRTPGAGILNVGEQKKVDSLINRKAISIILD